MEKANFLFFFSGCDDSDPVAGGKLQFYRQGLRDDVQNRIGVAQRKGAAQTQTGDGGIAA